MAMTLDDMVPATPGWRLVSPESAGSSALSSCLPSSRPVGRSEVVLGCVDWWSCCSSAVSCYGVLFPRHWQSRCENFKPTSSTTQRWSSYSHGERAPLLDFVRCPGKATVNSLTWVGPLDAMRAILRLELRLWGTSCCPRPTTRSLHASRPAKARRSGHMLMGF